MKHGFRQRVGRREFGEFVHLRKAGEKVTRGALSKLVYRERSTVGSSHQK